MNTIKNILRSDPTAKKFSEQLYELSAKFQVLEQDKKTGTYRKRWICNEAHAKYIFLKTELEEYIKIHFPKLRGYHLTPKHYHL